MNAAEIEAKLAPHLSGGELRLAAADLGSKPVEALLNGFFGGTLVAGVKAPEAGTSTVTFKSSTLATAGFSLYPRGNSLVATLVFSADATETIQLAATVELPAGFALADSFPALTASKSPLTAVSLSGASYTLDSTLPAGSVGFAATVDPSKGLLAPLEWLFLADPDLSGVLVPVELGTPNADFTGQLVGKGVESPQVGGFELASAVRLGSFRTPPKEGATIVQTVEAIVDLTTPAFTVPLAIMPLAGATTLVVSLDPLRPPPKVGGLAELAPLAGKTDPGTLLSKDTPIGDLSLDGLTFTLDTATKRIGNIQLAVGLGESWPVVDGLLTLDGLTAVVTVPDPLNLTGLPPSVLAGAELDLVSGKLDVYVQYPERVVGLTLAPGTEIDIDHFLEKLAKGARLPGKGDMSITALDAVADIGAGAYRVSAEVDGSLEVVEGIELDQISFSVEYAQRALQGLSFGCLFAIAGTELYLAAVYAAAGGGWRLEGGTYDEVKIDLTAIAGELSKAFGYTLPAGVPKVELSDLRLAPYETSSGDFQLEATVSVFIGGGIFKQVTAQLKIARATVKGKSAYSGEVKGTLTIGASELELSYDLHDGENIAALRWAMSEKKKFDIAPLIKQLTGSEPAIPEKLDLGLESLEAEWDVSKETLLLGAESANYGDAVLWSEPVGSDRLYAFGVEVPLRVNLADIPLVGDKIPDADQLGISGLGAWLLSGPLKKEGAEAINAKARTVPGKPPQLPAADAEESALVSAALVLGSDSIPLVVPLGKSTPPPPPQAGRSAPAAALPAAPVSPLAETPAAPADETRWFNVQRGFGVFYVDRIGVAYESGTNGLAVALDASIQLGPLTFSTQGLTVASPLTAFEPKFRMSGLGVSYAQPPLEIAGALLAIPEKQLDPAVAFQYDGLAVVKAEQFSLAAIASYAQEKAGDPSLFVFAQLEAPLGGPPEFFVTGLMAGFGYNRSLELPGQDEVAGFPLLALGMPPEPGTPAAKQDPAQILAILEGRAPVPGGKQKAWIAPKTGSYWIAAGLEATSYQLLDTKALLIAEFGDELAFALLGLSTLSLPQDAPSAETYAHVELALELVLEPEQGVFALTAVLTPSSYVIAPACHLTGGFAFFIWFGRNPRAGQFVITLGGYHPAFSPPAYFPAEPRLGFNWAVSSEISVKGGAYFALTPSCVMAGGGLEVTFRSGNLEAGFTAQADMLIAWHPFFYEAGIAVSIHVAYTLDLGFVSKRLSVSAGASVALQGPPTHGTVTVHLWFISFSVEFGARKTGAADAALKWPEFEALLPPRADVCKATVTGGLLAMADDPAAKGRKLWLVRPGSFAFTTEAAIPATAIAYGGTAGAGGKTGWALAIRPMDLAGVTSVHTVSITKVGEANPLDLGEWQRETRARSVPESLWGAPQVDAAGNFTQVPQRAAAEPLKEAPVGAGLQVPAPECGAAAGPVAIGELHEPVQAPEAARAVPARSPLAPKASAASGLLPGFDETSLTEVAEIDTAGAAARDEIHALLAAGKLYQGPNDKMGRLAAGASSLFSDPPLEVGG